MAVDEKQVGIIDKYRVERVSDPEGKHDDCWYFVLDPKHDPLAGPTLFEYADRARAAGYAALADDLLDRLARLAVERQGLAVTEGRTSSPPRRLRACVEAWPECWTMGYDPRCCRFPKSCSPTVYDEQYVTEDDLEPLSAPASRSSDVD